MPAARPIVMCTALDTESGPHLELLESQGFEVRHAPRERNLYDNATLVDVLRGASAVLAGSEPYPASVLQQLKTVRVLSRMGVGYDAIDTAACDALGIAVTTTPGCNHHAVAEHTLGMLLAVARGFPARDQHVRAATWKRFSTPRVMGRTLGLVGLGRIGQAVATRARGLGMHVVATDPYPPTAFASEWQVALVELEELLAKSDYVSLHLPVSQGSRHLLNASTLAKMKPGSVVINTARGALIDEPALIAALQSGHLRAAALDVFEVEPLPATSPLLQLENVLLSGHLAGLDHESHYDTLVMGSQTIIELHQGRWPADKIRNLAGITGWKW
jgi:D-3-phosphoglycerate dehydrogenase / 2-oxoglutarate reductase